MLAGDQLVLLVQEKFDLRNGGGPSRLSGLRAQAGKLRLGRKSEGKAMRVAAGFLFALLSLGQVQAAEPVWHWIWVVPSPDPTKGWKVFEGDAPVSFDGSALNATLKGAAEGWEPELRVVGRVKGRTIEAVVTEVGTDASPEQYKGGFYRWRSKPTDGAHGWGEDRIWLDVGPNHLGLYRQVPPK